MNRRRNAAALRHGRGSFRRGGMHWRSVLVPAISWRAASHVMCRTSSCRGFRRLNGSPRRASERGGMWRAASFKPAAPHWAVASHGVLGSRSAVTERYVRDTRRGARPTCAPRRSTRVRRLRQCARRGLRAVRSASRMHRRPLRTHGEFPPCPHGRCTSEAKRCVRETGIRRPCCGRLAATARMHTRRGDGVRPGGCAVAKDVPRALQTADTPMNQKPVGRVPRAPADTRSHLAGRGAPHDGSAFASGEVCAVPTLERHAANTGTVECD